MANTEKKPTNSKSKTTLHSRKVKKRYSKIHLSLWGEPGVKEKVKDITRLVSITKDNKKKADEIQLESQKVIKNSPPIQVLLEDLSIGSLQDIYDMETKGSVQRTDFFDLIRVNKKRQEVLKIVENNDKVLSKIRETQIEVLQLQIEKLIETIEDEQI